MQFQGQGTIKPATDPFGQRAFWADHINKRDATLEAFTTVLYGGRRTLQYTCRATTVGVFTAQPARAEEMYAPETFGRGTACEVQVV